MTPNQVFLDSVAHLMSSHQNSLTRKALELLLAKLESLTKNCPPATVILTFASETIKHSLLDATLENGLIHILDEIFSAIVLSPTFFSFDKGQTKLVHLRLLCLRRLAQLLCAVHPDKLLKVGHSQSNILPLHFLSDSFIFSSVGAGYSYWGRCRSLVAFLIRDRDQRNSCCNGRRRVTLNVLSLRI